MDVLKTALGRLRANQGPTTSHDDKSANKVSTTSNAVNPLTGQKVAIPAPPGPGSVTVDMTQTVDTTAVVKSAVGFGSLRAASDRWIMPLHPSNPVLFPNLAGIWQHYDRFAITHVNYRSVPTASLLAGGSVVLATLAPDQMKTLSFTLPSFVDLINFATSFVWPLASEAVSVVSSSILKRARDYLMTNENASLTTPGYLASAALNH